MFVKNFNNLLIANNYAPDQNEGSPSPMFQVVGTDGNKYTIGFQFFRNYYDGFNTKVFKIDNILFGDSDISENYNQYNIQGNQILIDNMTIKTVYGIDENGRLELCYVVSGTPTSNGTIKEIGLIKNVYRANESVGTSMIYREVLNSPIILEANTPINLMFKIKLLIK